MQHVVTLVTKVNAITTSVLRTIRLVPKMQYDSDTNNIEKEIEDVNEKLTSTTGLVKKADYEIKLLKLKTYQALLDQLLQLLSIQKLQRLKIKYQILINLATRAALNTKAEIEDVIMIEVI